MGHLSNSQILCSICVTMSLKDAVVAFGGLYIKVPFLHIPGLSLECL